MAIATAAHEIIVDGVDVAVGGGSQIHLSGTERAPEDRWRSCDPWLTERLRRKLYMSMLETAEIVSERYGVPREAQDEYALQSQRRTADAQQAGRFREEIAPF